MSIEPTGIHGAGGARVRGPWSRLVVMLLNVNGAIAVASAGCASSPKVQLLNMRAEPVYVKGRLVEVAFVSEVETSGLANEQIRFEVRLLDRKGRPIKSIDNQFMLPTGQVAATRTFMVNEAEEKFGVRVTIPADQLELRNSHLPASAEAELFWRIDESLAAASCMIPLARIGTEAEEAPARTAKPPTEKQPPAAGTKRPPAPVKPKPPPKPKPLGEPRSDRPV